MKSELKTWKLEKWLLSMNMSKIDRIRSQLSDGLEAAKVREHLSNAAIARAFEMGPTAVSRIIKGEDVKLNLNQALELLLLAGLEIKRGE